MPDLFRQEVAEYHADRLAGDVSIFIPVGWRIVGFLITLTVITAAIFVYFITYERSVTLYGVLVSDKGVASISSSFTGTIRDLDIREGEAVQAGMIVGHLTPAQGVQPDEATFAKLHASNQEGRGRSYGKQYIDDRPLLAPVAGRASGISVQVGQYVNSQTHLLDIVPMGGRIDAQLWLSADLAHLIKRGQITHIAFDEYGTTQMAPVAGQIASVSPVLNVPGAYSTEARMGYEARVRLSSPSASQLGFLLRPGMRVTANVILARRRLADYFLGPLSPVRSTS